MAEDGVDDGSASVSARDVGFLIRDLLEGHEGVSRFVDEPECELREVRTDAEVASVDVGDPTMPIVELSTGERFRVSILALRPRLATAA